MANRRLLATACLLSVLLPSRGHARQGVTSFSEGENQEVVIDAEKISYDQKTDTVTAQGHVVITRGETELRADEVRFSRTTGEADASGNVTISDPEGTANADFVHLNLNDETGQLGTAEITSRRLPYSLKGERVEKGLGQSYRIENGQFTTCRCSEGPPSWSISGQSLAITLGGYGTVEGGTFKVLDVPILYIPRGVFPAQRERETGFLMPRFGVSNRRGFQTLLPFYWAISKSQDATLGFDLETSARAGVVGEYRYALSRETQGILGVSYFNEALGGSDSGNPSQNRWSAFAEHDQPFVGASHLYADVFLVGDNQFLRDMNTYAFEHSREVSIRTLPYTDSRVGIMQEWNRIALKGEGTYYQDLTGPESTTLTRAPAIGLWGQTSLGEHLLGGLQTSLVDYQRTIGVTGGRLDVQPGVMVPLPLGPTVFGALRASLRETAYHLGQQAPNGSNQDLPRDQFRELVQVDGDIGTELSRIYPINRFGLEKIKHTIEPMFQYLYVPAVSQQDLPLFDGIDRVNHRNLFTYGVVSRIIGKFDDTSVLGAAPGEATTADAPESPTRELARLSLQQSFDASREINPLQTGRSADHFSDIDFAGRINPSPDFSLHFLTNYDTSNNNVSATSVGLFIEDPRYPHDQHEETDAPRLETRTSAGISYRVLTQNLLQEIDDNIVLRLTDWAGFLYSSRYDVVNNEFLDNYFGLRFISTCDCWAFDIAVVDRTNPQEVEVRAQLTLAGLGSNQANRRVAAMP